MPVRDELLRLTGTTGAPRQVITTTGDGSAVYVGRGRFAFAELRIGGAVTGTSPTLDVTIQESADGSTGWTVAATFPQRTTSDVVADQIGTGPNRVGVAFTKDYARASRTIGGTSHPHVQRRQRGAPAGRHPARLEARGPAGGVWYTPAGPTPCHADAPRRAQGRRPGAGRLRP